MHNTAERAAAIAIRTRELKHTRRARQTSLAMWFSSAACLALIAAAALTMPTLMARQIDVIGSGSDAAAGVLAESGASGYVLVGLLAFSLGCGVTILCYRLRRRDRERRDG